MKPSEIKVGDRFGKLVVAKNNGYPKSRWICRCDCGRERGFQASRLAHGFATSCGCVSREKENRKRNPSLLTHHPLYHIWLGILARCNPENAQDYPRYAGRGITVSDRWKNSFDAFVEDMGPRPSPDHSIDRADNDGHYEPGNCRWATPDVQRRNCIAIHPLVIRGQTKCVMDWAKESGIGVQTIYRRLRRGWEPEDAVFHIGSARVDRENVRR